MYKHIIDRGNLDDIVAYQPKTKRNITRREDLEEHPVGHPRADIVLINGTRNDKQYCLYVTHTGYTGDLFILDFLTDKEFEQVEDIARRMRQNAIDFEPAERLIY